MFLGGINGDQEFFTSSPPAITDHLQNPNGALREDIKKSTEGGGEGSGGVKISGIN